MFLVKQYIVSKMKAIINLFHLNNVSMSSLHNFQVHLKFVTTGAFIWQTHGIIICMYITYNSILASI